MGGDGFEAVFAKPLPNVIAGRCSRVNGCSAVAFAAVIFWRRCLDALASNSLAGRMVRQHEVCRVRAKWIAAGYHSASTWEKLV